MGNLNFLIFLSRACRKLIPRGESSSRNRFKNEYVEGRRIDMKNLQRQGIIPWLLLGVMGILCIVFSRTMTNVVEIILGIGLILAGAGGVIGWWQQGRSRSRNDLITLLVAAAGIALGIWILTHLNSFDKILNVILGVGLILAGLQYVLANWKTMGLNAEIIMAGLAVVLGVVILVSTPRRCLSCWRASA